MGSAVKTSVNCASRSPAADTVGDHSGHCPEGEIGGIIGPGGPGGPEAEIPRISRILGVLGETMVSMESVAPVRFKWVRREVVATLKVQFRDQIRDFGTIFGPSRRLPEPPGGRRPTYGVIFITMG